jgi:hypothetical protein
MDVIRHDDVAVDFDKVLLTGLFENFLEFVAGGWGPQELSVAETTTGDEVEMTGLLVADQAGWHVRQFTLGICDFGSEGGLASLDTPPFR